MAVNLPTRGEVLSRWRNLANSTLVFREVLQGWRVASEAGKPELFEDLVAALDSQCEWLVKHGLGVTPLVRSSRLERALSLPPCTLFMKDETKFIMGSHKARHQLGAIIAIEVDRKLAAGNTGNSGQEPPKRPLAIFSCGNAALGAAAIARAARYPLYTFVPNTISAEVESLLSNLEARVVKVPRDDAVGTGDPCYNRYEEAINKLGLFPFSCYGVDNWCATEGAQIMGLEFIAQIIDSQNEYSRNFGGDNRGDAVADLQPACLDNVVVQVGGGGLANAICEALFLAKKIEMIVTLPRIFTVQTQSCYPLAQAYLQVLALFVREQLVECSVAFAELLAQDKYLEIMNNYMEELSKIARQIALNKNDARYAAVLEFVGKHRNTFIKPWSNNVPHSIADGILDDTTYDGVQVMFGMFATGGLPIVLSEEELARAWQMAKDNIGIDVSATGSAGLGGYVWLQEHGIVNKNEKTALFLTGIGERKASRPCRSENVLVLHESDPIERIEQKENK